MYAVKTTTDPDDPQEVATVDNAKKAILKDIFWRMNELSSRTESKPKKSLPKPTTATGTSWKLQRRSHAPIFISRSVTRPPMKWQTISTSTPTSGNSFPNCLPRETAVWSAVLYGIYSGDDATIVTVALSQVGNVGGQPYWSWYGFDGRVEWCACFVSWCANECGYIDSGVIPKFAGCVNGVQWFKDRGQWQDGSFEPSAGQIIFF